MGGNKQHQDDMHQSVMEHIAGVPPAKHAATPPLTRLSVITAALGTGLLLYASLANKTNNGLVGMGFGLITVSLPFLVLAQRFALHLTLHRHNLRATNLLIGKRERNLKDIDFTKPDVELFFAAASHVCNLTTDVAPIWELQGAQMIAPGVAGITVNFHENNQQYLCLYGETKAVLGMCSDIWDFGYTRALASTDHERFIQTAKKWGKTHALPVALAYLPISNASDAFSQTISHATLLGLLQIQTTRGDRKIISVSPTRSLYLGTLTQLGVTTSLGAFAVINLLAAAIFSTPLAFGFWQYLLLGWLVMSIPLATSNWDQATSKAIPKTYPVATIVWMAVLVSGVSFGSYIMYLFSSSDVVSSAISRGDKQAAAATALLTFGVCWLINLLLDRSDNKHLSRQHTSNPLFLLGMLCAILLLLTSIILTGPLTALGLLIAMSSAGIYVGIRKLVTYTNTHHTRDHIIDLLSQN